MNIFYSNSICISCISGFAYIFTDKRTELITFLKKHKISTRPVYGEINKTKMFYNKDIFENSQYVSKNGLFLPSYITIKDEDIKQICKLIQLFYLNINSVTENK